MKQIWITMTPPDEMAQLEVEVFLLDRGWSIIEGGDWQLDPENDQIIQCSMVRNDL